jgi:hypothetical protein
MLATWTLLALALGGNMLGGPAHAGNEAESCMQAKTWENYEAGSSLRTVSLGELQAGERLTLKSTLYRGREYLIQACGSSQVHELDLILFDLAGKEVGRATGGGKEAELRHKSKSATETLYIVAHVRRAAPGAQDVSIGVFYR